MSTSKDISNEDDEKGDVALEYLEHERVLLRARAEKALIDVKSMLEAEKLAVPEKRKIEKAVGELERVVECMADESLPCSTPEALESEVWFEYDELRHLYAVSASMPMLLEAFVILVDRGVAPGKWVLEPLADAFAKILEDADPDLVATHLRLQGKGSGSKSPLKDHDRIIEQAQVNLDMRTLIEKFGVSHTVNGNIKLTPFSAETAR